MIREEIKKNIAYGSLLRERIKITENENIKKELYKELAETYEKLEFLRGLVKVMYKYEKKGKMK